MSERRRSEWILALLLAGWGPRVDAWLYNLSGVGLEHGPGSRFQPRAAVSLVAGLLGQVRPGHRNRARLPQGVTQDCGFKCPHAEKTGSNNLLLLKTFRFSFGDSLVFGDGCRVAPKSYITCPRTHQLGNQDFEPRWSNSYAEPQTSPRHCMTTAWSWSHADHLWHLTWGPGGRKRLMGNLGLCLSVTIEALKAAVLHQRLCVPETCHQWSPSLLSARPPSRVLWNARRIS